MLRRWMILAMCAASLMSGCATVTHVNAGRHDRYRNALVDSCRSIKQSNFQAARGHLRDAQALANGPGQAAKVADLELVCDGAESMSGGRPYDAADSWLAIQDRSLKNQLLALADDEGIDLIALANTRQAGGEVMP